VFYLFGVLGDGYYGLIFPLFNMPFWGMILKIYFKLFSTTRNGLFFAFFFVALGMFFANREVSIDRKKLFFFFGISVILLVLEVYMLQVFNIPKDHNILIFIVPSVIFAFLCLIKIKLKNNVIYTYIRKMSSLTFYLHPWILLIYTKSSEFLNINIQGTPIPFLFVLFVTVVLSITIIKLSKTKYFKWLKNIY
jgi:serine/alanine racemase